MAGFLILLAPLFAAITNMNEMATLWWWLFGLGVLGFLGLAAFHENISAKIRKLRMLIRIDRDNLKRMDRKLRDLKVDSPIPEDFQSISRDLDLFGDNSLFKLLGIAKTPIGVETLTNWMLQGADPASVSERQDAVRSLVPLDDWRYRFQILCEQLAASPTGPRDFVEWCQQAGWLRSRSWILWLSRIAAVSTLVLIALTIFGIIPLAISAWLLLATVLVNFFLSVFYAGPVHDVFNQISSRYQETAAYKELFENLRTCEAQATRLETLREQLFHSGDTSIAMNSLGRYVWLANVRRHGFLFGLYLIAQLTLFWDLHVLERLEAWQVKYGKNAKDWFTALGEWEALNALAKCAWDHPDWTFPHVVAKNQNSQRIIGKRMGHPLLPQQSRVDNDLEMGPQGSFLLVTGSDMSGKSTLLRTIGLNVTLAQMGSAVCAEHFETPYVAIDTSMRISDSLADGVSFFMAELKRLKEIVDHSSRYTENSQQGHLFLLDEILQGTNSRERQIAVAQVVRQLVDQGSIGAISTHDLELAGVDSLKNNCQIVHFSESFEEQDGQEVMTFDYRMQPGVAPTTNALKLLELVGLGKGPQPSK
ncbi:MAG: hypothetical protein R3C03_19615 [Pirellulaceae bacterium]